MRIVQKSLMHTGYIILKNGSYIPLWSDNLYVEADKIIKERFRGDYAKIDVILATNAAYTKIMLHDIKAYKEKYGVIPQALMDELRTGFSSDSVSGLKQQKTNLHCYK